MDGLNDLLPPRDHNEPPLAEILDEEAAPLARRRDELLQGVSRAPAEIADEETNGKCADLVRLINACVKNAEAARTARKEPFLAGGRLVDATYKKITEPLDKAKRAIEARITAYQRRKAEEERRRREEEARRQAEEAERQRQEAEAAAAALQSEDQLDDAIAAEERARQAAADAEKARKESEAKPADLSRTRGDLGAVASLRTFWDFKDLDRAKVDLEALRGHLAVDAIEKAVRSYIRASFAPGKPGKQIAGVVIFENTSATVR